MPAFITRKVVSTFPGIRCAFSNGNRKSIKHMVWASSLQYTLPHWFAWIALDDDEFVDILKAKAFDRHTNASNRFSDSHTHYKNISEVISSSA